MKRVLWIGRAAIALAASISLTLSVAAAAPPASNEGSKGPGPAGGSKDLDPDSRKVREAATYLFDHLANKKCLQFDTPADERDFRSKSSDIRRTAEEQFALGTEEGEAKALGQIEHYRMLVAEFSNPSCAENGQWRVLPTWPKGELGAMQLNVWGSEEEDHTPAEWNFLGAAGTGHWKSGSVAALTLELDKPGSTTFVIHRTDSSGPTAGLTANYLGAPRHNFLIGLYSSTWPGHWKDKRGVWYGTFGFKQGQSGEQVEPDRAQSGTVPHPGPRTGPRYEKRPSLEEEAPQGAVADGRQFPPGVMHICLANCGTLYLTTDRRGYTTTQGAPALSPEGYGLRIRRFTRDSVVLDRTDPPNQWFPQGLKAVISGRVSAAGNSLDSGRIDWTFGQPGAHGALMTWGTALNDIPGEGKSPWNLVNAPPGSSPLGEAPTSAAGADDTSARRAMQLLGNIDLANTREWRVECVMAVAQENVDKIRRRGTNVTLADQCIAALRWTAHDGRLMDIYINENNAADEPSARLLLKNVLDDAARETAPFVPHGTPEEMWQRGDNTPSYVFDAAFTLAFLEKSPPPKSLDLAQLRRQTEACFDMSASPASCIAAGRAQGALAYQAQDSVGQYHGTSETQ